MDDSMWNEGVKSVIDSVLKKEDLEHHKRKRFTWNDDWSHIPRLTSYICNPTHKLKVAYDDEGNSNEVDEGKNVPVKFVEIHNDKAELVSELSCSIADYNADNRETISEQTETQDDMSICDEVHNVFDLFEKAAIEKWSTSQQKEYRSTFDSEETPSTGQNDYIATHAIEKWDPVTAFKAAFTQANVNAAAATSPISISKSL